jgi:para-aminobenzoate synthetase component I
VNIQVVEPLVEELEGAPDAATVFSRLSHLPHCLFLDSAMRHGRLGRYSFIAADPFDSLLFSSKQDAFGPLERALAGFRTATIPGLPPFQGGVAGMFGYDLGRQLEKLPRSRVDEFGFPVLALGLYDVVVAFDHQDNRAWIFSSGLPERSGGPQANRAKKRLEWFKTLAIEERSTGTRARQSHRIVEAAKLSPQFHTGQLPQLTSNFARTDYLAAVQRVIDYICAGDVFQVNLSQRLLHPAVDDSVALYHRLRERNPAPFAGYFDLGEFQIVSASPERFVQVLDRWVETRPIKGTGKRSERPLADTDHGTRLRASEKDRAENVMIVDLLRNDLSRVCQAASVQVTELCTLERYQYVQHLVSAVRGRLRDDADCVDLIRAAFPGGSVTGAPKVRAMEIIAELEPTSRGPYCGSLGYLGFDGTMDLSILIRTITAGRGWWQAPVGGGIVAQSQPEAEYEETWHKAEGMLRSFAK